MRARIWICPFCLQRNNLPPHYRDISEQQIPPELHPGSTTIEYELARPAPTPPIFLFVIDTCQEEDSLKALKDSVIMSLSLLPANALVGLVTYGTMVRYRLPCSIRELLLILHTRHKYTSWDTPSAPSHMSSGVARTTRRNRSRKCLD